MKPLLHLWSFGIEEQFYLAWPPLLWLACRAQRPLALTSTILLVSLALNLSLLSSASVSTFYLPHTRVWELLLGAWLAIWEAQGESPSMAQAPLARNTSRPQQLWQDYGSDLVIFSALLMLFVPMFAYGKDDPYTRLARPAADRRRPAHPRGRFAGVAQSSCVSPSCARLRWFDQLSALSLALAAAVSHPHQRGDHPSIIVRSLAMLVAIGLAWLTYRFLERPIRRNGGARSVIALLVFAAGLGALGVASWYGVGPRPRLDYLTAELAEFAPMSEDSKFHVRLYQVDAIPYALLSYSSPPPALRRLR